MSIEQRIKEEGITLMTSIPQGAFTVTCEYQGPNQKFGFSVGDIAGAYSNQWKCIGYIIEKGAYKMVGIKTK